MKKTEAVGILKCIGGTNYKLFVEPRLRKLQTQAQADYNKATAENWQYLKAKMDGINETISYLGKLSLVAKKKVVPQQKTKIY